MTSKIETIIKANTKLLKNLSGKKFDVISIRKPNTLQAAINLSKIISKLSPLVGNLIEFETVDYLNANNKFRDIGVWKRQDPGFPDTIFYGKIKPPLGFEIKAWFPLATEMTARFKDSQSFFIDNQTYIVILAWLPEHILYGKPKILDVVTISGASVAKVRDIHYHNPPDYIVIEPEDTSHRTVNLQQTNTNGYKFQGTKKEIEEARRLIETWGKQGRMYSQTKAYQEKIRNLLKRYKYRLDTNYAKIDRINHPTIETFKNSVLNKIFKGEKIVDWQKNISSDKYLEKLIGKSTRLK